MFDVIPFAFRDRLVRVIMRDGEPWFAVPDVCRVLDIANPSRAIARLPEKDVDQITLDELNSGRPLADNEGSAPGPLHSMKGSTPGPLHSMKGSSQKKERKHRQHRVRGRPL